MGAMNELIDILRRSIDSGDHSVAAIAARCGCSRTHIYNVLNREQQPTLALAEKIADAIGAEITVKTKRRKKISA